MTKRNLSLLLYVLLVTEAFIVGAIVSVTSSPSIGVPVAIAAVVFPILIMRIVALALVKVGLLARLSREFPLRDGAFPNDGSTAISSVSLGTRSFRLNNCVILSADDQYLHLQIAVPTVRNSTGTSIPWEQVESIAQTMRSAEICLFDGGKLWIPWKYAQAESALRDSIERSAD